jgi:protein-tyrosine phosphatase
MLISDAVHIWREPEGDYLFEWQVSDPDTRVTVEPLNSSAGLQLHYQLQPAPGARLSGLPEGSRHYFRLSDQYGNQLVATERRLGMQGAPNFRDFGGYSTTDGRQLKWGYLFRSGQLSKLSDQDVALLDSLGLDLVCDFRRVEEQDNDRSRLPARSPAVISLPIIPGSNSKSLEVAHEQMNSATALFDFMVDINREFVESQAEAYARMFREILAVEDARFLVHCAAGKDRTGFAAAIIQLALGVPRDVVMQDYMLTGRYFLPEREMERIRLKYQMEDMVDESILPVLEVHADYLERALRAIEDNYGTVEDYLQQALGVGPVELAELRNRYLE